MTHKIFSERLNKELDSIDLPIREDERIDTFAIMFKLPKFKAHAIIDGITLPDPALLESIANELEVNPEWLIGHSDDRKRK